MDFSTCYSDATFGPQVQGCRSDFDFTLKFEKIVLSILPSSVFIIVSSIRVSYLVRRPVLVDQISLKVLKFITLTTYIGLQLALLVTSNDVQQLYTLSVTAAVLAFLASICILVLSVLEHIKAPRPSIILELYLVLTLLFDIAQTRTIWLVIVGSRHIHVPWLWTASVVLKAVLLVLELPNKSRWVKWETKGRSPEETSGLFGLGVFFWVNGLLLKGYKKVLHLEDLFPLDQSMATTAMQERLLESLKYSCPKLRKHGFGLAKALASTLSRALLIPVAPRMALLAFKFCQPFLMRTLLDSLQQPASEVSRNSGYGLIGATALIYSGIALSTSLYWYYHERALCMSRGCLVGAIYRKTTETRLSTANDAATITLMSTDVERIRLGFLNLHEFWANMIEVALASWLLQRQLGAAFAAPLVVVICCIMAGTYTNLFTSRRQKEWMSKIQKRVGLTASVISQMKNLKISGLAGPVERLIQDMRVDELRTASKYRIIYILVITFGYIPTALCPVMTFAFTSRTLDVSTIFTSMSYIILLADPLGYLFQNTPNLLAAFACLDRIQKFFELESRDDYRLQVLEPTKAARVVEESDHNGSNQDADLKVSIRQASFGWQRSEPILKNINLDIHCGAVTMIIGPVGAGKSSLCKAILAELPLLDGQIFVTPDVFSKRVAYCDQSPFLTSGTIRDNIIGFSPFDDEKYQLVVNATVLDFDYSLLPLKDQTAVGSHGISLSGGQRQRIAIARALYCGCDFFVFDDVLSGLDNTTANQVLQNVFGSGGYLKRLGATSILCTHNTHHLHLADHVVVMNPEGSIAEQDSAAQFCGDKLLVNSINSQLKDWEERTEFIKHESKLDLQAPVTPNLSAELEVSLGVTNDSRMKGDSAVYRYYFSTLGIRSFVAFAVFGLGWGFFYNWGNVWLKFWSEDVSSPRPQRSNSFYIGMYALFQMIYVLSMFFVFLICYTTMIQLSGSKLHRAALRTIHTAPLRFFSTTDTGVITNMFSQDMTLIDHELPIAVTNLALDICNALGMAAVIASSSPYLAIAYPFLFAALCSIQKFYLRTSRQLRLLDLEAKSPLYTHFLDTIKGLATYRAFGWTADGIQVNDVLLDTSQRPTYLLAIVQRWLLFSLQTVVTLLAIAVVAMATQMRSSTALTGAGIITLMTFGDILNYIIRWFTQLETSIGAVSRIKSFSENVVPETAESENQIPPEEWPSSGHIELRNVSASYNTHPDHDEADPDLHSLPQNLAVRCVSFSIQDGEKVAICGRTGSGKSSIILLLLKLLDLIPSDQGDVVIDGLSLHNIDRATLRERIIAIPQEPVFLPDGTSVLANMDPFGASDETECQAILELVGLWPLFVHRGGLAEGLISQELSMGQKQLFSLARVILRHRTRLRKFMAQSSAAPEKTIGGILLLDEISSSVDRETDHMMQNIIMEEFQSYTIVMVSHRLDMVMDFDTVVVMDNGSIRESGSPRKLKDKVGGQFRELWLASR